MKKRGSEANSAAVVAGASGTQQVINTMRSSSPTKSKRSPVKQLGSPYKLRKLSRGGDSSGGGGGGEKKPPTIPSSSIGIISPTSLFGLSKNPADYFHKDCKLQKEVGRDTATQKLSTRSLSTTSTKSSASGRAATLIKLQEKLSLLGDIESGKYGMAAEMLRSDAVAFAIQPDGSSNSTNSSSSSSTPPRKKNNRVQKVETRSILTLRMGFVSICYGILLQWDCKSGLVELIVLRKMCHDDFLKRKGNDPSSSSSTTAAKESKSSHQQLIPKSSSPFLPPMPALIPIPLPTNSPTEVSLDSASTSIVARGGSKSSSRITLPHFSLPSYPLIGGIPRFLSSTTTTSSAADNSTTGPAQHYLSVSVLGVTKLVSECINCRRSTNTTDGSSETSAAYSAIPSWNKRKLPTTTPTTTMTTTGHNQSPIRPYIRFSLGKHEHQTSVTRYYGKGSAKWSKRHDNTCLLPCPPEEMHWFAGREDLIVEVRNDWQQQSNNTTTVFGMNYFGERNNNNPILASVKLPLSSINIENVNDDITARGGTWKRRTNLYSGTSSTKITIPLRMNCCSNAPMGSITLEITMNAPSKGSATTEASSKHASSSTTTTTQLPIIQVTNESIELGPLTRLIDGWSLGEWGGGDVEEINKKKNFRWSKRFDLQTGRWTKLIGPKPTNPPPSERPWLVSLF
jgi:hypothetical protein